MEEPLPEKSYRPRRFYLYLGSVFTGILLILSVGFILAVIMNWGDPTDFPAAAAIFTFLIWSAFLTLGIWVILSYLRERLIISESTITMYDVSRKTVIPIDKISQIIWFTGFGAIRIESPGGSFKFNMESFTQPEQKEIIAFLRKQVDLEKQKRWDYFYESYRQVIDPQATATRNEKILATVVLVLVVVFFCGWWFGSGSGLLLTALLCVFGALRIYQGH